MLTPIEIALKHLRVDADDDEADLIGLYLAAAEDAALSFMNRQVFADADAMTAATQAGSGGEYPIVVTAAMQAAILLILGQLYENRENAVIGVTAMELPNGAFALLQPYRMNLGV